MVWGEGHGTSTLQSQVAPGVKFRTGQPYKPLLQGLQSVVLRPVAAASPGNLLEMQMPRLHPNELDSSWELLHPPESWNDDDIVQSVGDT